MKSTRETDKLPLHEHCFFQSELNNNGNNGESTAGKLKTKSPFGSNSQLELKATIASTGNAALGHAALMMFLSNALRFKMLCLQRNRKASCFEPRLGLRSNTEPESS